MWKYIDVRVSTIMKIKTNQSKSKQHEVQQQIYKIMKTLRIQKQSNINIMKLIQYLSIDVIDIKKQYDNFKDGIANQNIFDIHWNPNNNHDNSKNHEN